MKCINNKSNQNINEVNTEVQAIPSEGAKGTEEELSELFDPIEQDTQKQLGEIDALIGSSPDGGTGELLQDGFEDDDPFPVECLPKTMRDMVKAVHRYSLMDISNVAACALGAAFTTLGKGICIKNTDGRRTFGNQAIWIGAESGTGKSLMFEPLMNPIVEIEQDALDKWEKEVRPDAVAEIQICQRLIKDLLERCKGEDVDRQNIRQRIGEEETKMENAKRLLNRPMLYVTDATQEAVETALAKNNGMISVLASEGRKVAKNVLGKKGDSLNIDTFLCLGTGDSMRVSRASKDGRNYDIKNAWGNMLVLVQPDMILKILQHEEAIPSGFAPRCLTVIRVAPDPIEEGVAIPQGVMSPWNAEIKELMGLFRLGEKLIEVEIPPSLSQIVAKDKSRIARKINDGVLYHHKECARRWTETLLKIALVLHAWINGVKAGDVSIAPETLNDARKIRDWFASHQMESMGQLDGGEANHLRTKIIHYIRDTQDRTKRTRRSIARRFGIKANMVMNILKPYLESGEVLEEKEIHPQGGQPSYVYSAK